MKNKYSIYKIAGFPEKLRSFREGKVTAPICVRVKPTNWCCHDCFFCTYKHSFSEMHSLSPDRESDWSGKISELPTLKLLELMGDFQKMGVKAVTFSGGGEPLMHPGIVRVAESALQKGLDLSLITNGQLLSGTRAQVFGKGKWVRVSVDYHTAEQMKESRGVDKSLFRRVLRNLEFFAKTKDSGCDLYLNYVVHRGNFLGLFKAMNLYRDVGVENIRFSPMWTPDFQSYHTPILGTVRNQLLVMQRMNSERVTISSTYDLDSTCHQSTRSYDHCYFCQVVPVVGADGFVYACHNKAYDPLGCIGSLQDQTFRELWESEQTRTFFRNLRPSKHCLHPCANDEKNLFIQEIVNEPDNFV